MTFPRCLLRVRCRVISSRLLPTKCEPFGRSEFDHVAVGVGDVDVGHIGCVFAAPNKAAAASLNRLDGLVIADPEFESEPEMLNAAALAGQPSWWGLRVMLSPLPAVLRNTRSPSRNISCIPKTCW